eukprot:scaffold10_cov257-Pinguiococcus_pyrenoidosus.AAC.58
MLADSRSAAGHDTRERGVPVVAWRRRRGNGVSVRGRGQPRLRKSCFFSGAGDAEPSSANL